MAVGCGLVCVAHVLICAPGLHLCVQFQWLLFSVHVNVPLPKLHYCSLSVLVGHLSFLLNRMRMETEPGS